MSCENCKTGIKGVAPILNITRTKNTVKAKCAFCGRLLIYRVKEKD